MQADGPTQVYSSHFRPAGSYTLPRRAYRQAVDQQEGMLAVLDTYNVVHTFNKEGTFLSQK